ncbi:MAG: hypothetical protein ACK55I_20430, partial [bacterium]
IDSLKLNPEASQTDLIIFSDGPRTSSDEHTVEQLRAYLKTLTGFKSLRIIERTTNLGLSRSIILGVTTVIAKTKPLTLPMACA